MWTCPWSMLGRTPPRLPTERLSPSARAGAAGPCSTCFPPLTIAARAKTPIAELTSKQRIDQFLTWKIAMAEPVSALPPSSVRDEPVPWPQRPATAVDPRVAPPYESTSKLRTLADDWYRQARLGLGEARRWVSGVTSRSRRNLRYLAEERPVQVVIGVAAACFLAGAALRIWRSSHE